MRPRSSVYKSLSFEQLECRVADLYNVCYGADEARAANACEKSRLLVTAGLQTVVLSPKSSVSSEIACIEKALCWAAGWTLFVPRSIYHRNISDRLIDFHAFVHAWTDEAEGMSPLARQLTGLLVMMRHFRRECVRESSDAVDESRGRDELVYIAQACERTYASIDETFGGTIAGQNAAQALWHSLAQMWIDVQNVLNRPDFAKKEAFRLTLSQWNIAIDALTELWEIMGLPETKAPSTYVPWREELLYAVKGCMHFSTQDHVSVDRKDLLHVFCDPWQNQRRPVDLDQGRTPMDLEKEFTAAVNEGRVSDPVELESLRANLQLQVSHPGEYVAFVDEWDRVSDPPRLNRKVLAASKSDKDMKSQLREALKSIELKQGERVRKLLVRDPYAGIDSIGRLDLLADNSPVRSSGSLWAEN